MRPESEQGFEYIQRIERAMVLLAYFMELDGEVYLPLYEKLEREYETMKCKYAARERARRLLASYVGAGDLRAIRRRNFSFRSSAGPLPYFGLPVRCPIKLSIRLSGASAAIKRSLKLWRSE